MRGEGGRLFCPYETEEEMGGEREGRGGPWRPDSGPLLCCVLCAKWGFGCRPLKIFFHYFYSLLPSFPRSLPSPSENSLFYYFLTEIGIRVKWLFCPSHVARDFLSGFFPLPISPWTPGERLKFSSWKGENSAPNSEVQLAIFYIIYI